MSCKITTAPNHDYEVKQAIDASDSKVVFDHFNPLTDQSQPIKPAVPLDRAASTESKNGDSSSRLVVERTDYMANIEMMSSYIIEIIMTVAILSFNDGDKELMTFIGVFSSRILAYALFRKSKYWLGKLIYFGYNVFIIVWMIKGTIDIVHNDYCLANPFSRLCLYSQFLLIYYLYAEIFKTCGMILLLLVSVLIQMCLDRQNEIRHRRTVSKVKKIINKIPTKLYEEHIKTDRDKDDEHENCSICLEEYVANDCIKKLPCGHEFHDKCIDPWLLQFGQKADCPLCRENVADNVV
jgi:hypothetical protein